jgi:Flp pilus assembly pilin Flp
MVAVLCRLWKEEEGQDLMEYILLLVLLALAGISAMKGLATAIGSSFSSAASNLASLN